LFLVSLVGRCRTNSRSFHLFHIWFGRRSHYLCRYSRQSPLPCFPKKRDPHIHQPSRRSILPLTKSARSLPFKQKVKSLLNKKIPAISKIASISLSPKRTAVSRDYSIESVCIFRHRWMVWVSNFFNAGVKSR
jgi:hypothetical protein